MRRHTAWLGASLLTLGICASVPALANPVADLQTGGHLTISTRLVPAEGIVPGQKVRLTIEIGTDRWFSGGTRIAIPEVAGLVILQNEQFASNASETREGRTWVIQRWTLDVFPQRAGDFSIPQIPVRLQVNTGQGGDAEGTLPGPATRFSASIPAGLAQASQWVAAPTFTVRQSFDKTLEGLAVGDAFEQEIVFEASDTMAMMLPDYPTEKLTGLAAYPSPPVLDNSVNRGMAVATRRVHISYVAEAPGKYLLPATDYFWWNTQSAELELVSLPETRFEVTGATAVAEKPAAFARMSLKLTATIVAGLLLLVASLLLLRASLSKLPITRWQDALSTQRRRLRALRKPALPDRLNPGSSAEG